MPSDSSEILRRWYAGPYSEITVSANGSPFERYMHAALERPFTPADRFPRVLEVGGNRGEHLTYVRHAFDEYVLSDLVQPDPLPEVAGDPRVRLCECDAADIPFPDESFDRVVITCVLHHVDSPLDVAEELRRVVRPGGVVSILLPTDPGAAYRWGKEATSGLLALRRGLHRDLQLVNAIAHHNHFRSIRTQLRYAFSADDVRIRWLPFGAPSMNLNAFTTWTITRR